MKLRLIVEKDAETGRYSSVFPELPGCASAGDTEDEAIANAKEALELWFEPMIDFCNPVRVAAMGVELIPGWRAEAALTPGYFISRRWRDEKPSLAVGLVSCQSARESVRKGIES